MATNSPPSEDYIDIEVMNYCPSIVSFPQNRQFEFQMASITNDEKTSADELFYKGKLLPLINQKILPNSKDSFEEEEFFSINLLITPSGSCRVSLELNPNDHFIELSTELINSPKKVWSKKLKLIKQSSFSQKIKASKAYLKSLFCKSASTYEYDQQISNGNDMIKVSKKIPLKNNRRCASPKQDSIIKNIDKERAVDNVSSNNHSRSFSAAKFKRNSPAKSGGSTSFSSSNCSFNSNNGFYELNLFKRSSSFTSEMGSIEAAIAHCKNS
ncbi:PREDICTED: probable membrane-associated kinase regulator 4 [Nicotiana attenuata]|uniref:Membrane-associated kinase regulator 4 n=1 Tax=Nicotiana attenuata TaxID=49451 RepID=A0A314KQX9_NICAT|nr:PREDICTED: probable membrane-associated kinase regulator 4 [Nicotiana attenuata]OIT31776.1 putative membrane-associated kinase regulator 4 [Nicotiana attenuata]